MATVPFSFECSKDAGFVMDPNEHKRVGYVVALEVLGIEAALKTDLRVTMPLDPGAAPGALGAIRTPAGAPATAEVVGVIEKFEWTGGAGDSLQFEFYASQENAVTIKERQQLSPLSKVTRLDSWIADFDHETRECFRQSYPVAGAVGGTFAGKEAPQLDVDLTPVLVREGVGVNVYKVSMSINPALHTCGGTSE